MLLEGSSIPRGGPASTGTGGRAWLKMDTARPLRTLPGEVVHMHTLSVLDPTWRLLGCLSTGDIAVILILVVNMAIGFWTGFLWQFVRIASITACIAITLLYSPLVAESLDLDCSMALKLQMSAIGVFATTLTVAYLASYLLRDLLNALKPRVPDRALGAVFGAIKGALVIGAVALLVLLYGDEKSNMRAQVEQSRAATTMGYFLEYAVPDSVMDGVKTAAGLESQAPEGPSRVAAARRP